MLISNINQSKLILLLITLFTIITFSYAQEQSTQKIPPFDFSLLKGKRIQSEEEISKFLNDTDMTVFAFYYKKKSPTSNGLASILNIITPKIEYMAEIILIDCDDENLYELSQCRNNGDNEDQFVYFEVHEPPVYKFNPYTKVQNTHIRKQYTKNQVTDKNLLAFITSNVISRAQKVTKQNYELFISQANLNKFILFTEKDKTPLLFRGISNYFYDQILFGEVNKSEKDLCDKLGITKFPTLMLYQSHEDGVIMDEGRIEFYKGKNTASEIVKFLKEYALKDKYYKGINTGASKSKYDIYFKKLSTSKVMEFFEQNNKKNLVLYFDNSLSDLKNINDIDYSKLSDDIKEFNSQTHGFFKFGYVDCSGKENELFCETNFKIDEFPSMILFKAKSSDNDEEEKFYSSINQRIERGSVVLSLEFSDIRREMQSLYEGVFKVANKDTISMILNEVSNINHKIPILYLFDSYVQIGITLVTMEQKFKQIFEWVIYDNPPSDFMRNLGIVDLPSMVIAINDNTNKGAMKMIPYQDKITYSKVKAFLENTFRFENNEQQSQSSQDNTKAVEPSLDFVTTTDELVKNCMKKKLCMIAFFDQRENSESKENFDNKFEIYKEASIAAAKRPLSFVYVNATCQSEFASKFGIDIANLPNLVIYSYNKDVFTRFIGAFKKEDIDEFITKTISGRANFQKIQKENVVLADVKCEEIQEFVETDEDDELMKELLEEERKKREMFEQEREKLAGEGKKKKKKKKKSKKKKEKEDL